ncbi:unnamed protein product [Rotaria magnacalcarata]|uniref:Copper transport protein n=1 Tax=Rotaria magnacalcarata TaxID=392030 RepID=A0A815G7R6_9BILA|nr:unnamed protein product [Rotaria magnacalcarata]CAF1335072.1 unnamed protein product [Rotaria magnacalcarata]CAF2029489.1 unnamed protein product [Rotaria magnacalcarata]CAF2123344.1 unnamed protein product [Rotaria magnacalcarata]CAF2135221.1 unnamed protein product [Rotaria magnacalcarata]
MQYFRDYRVKCFVILAFISLFICVKLNSKSDNDKRQQLLSSEIIMSHLHHHTGAMSSGHELHMKDMMMMAMTFHGGYNEQILFDQWHTTTVGAFTASWFAVFFFAVLYEALKTFRDSLSKRDFCQACSQTENRQQTLARLLSFSHAIQTLLHIVQMAFSYLLMLVAMTYNTYLLIAIVLGAGLGHFLFGWRRSSVIDYNEHCH